MSSTGSDAKYLSSPLHVGTETRVERVEQTIAFDLLCFLVIIETTDDKTLDRVSLLLVKLEIRYCSSRWLVVSLPPRPKQTLWLVTLTI